MIDGGGNGVNTLRAFDDSDEYFITILDENHVKEKLHLRAQIATERAIAGNRSDTELDQIMTCFKMSFVNLCSLF